MSNPQQELAQAISDFRKNPLVKIISKTKIEDLRPLAKAMPINDRLSLFRSYRRLISNPLVRRVLESNIGKPFSDRIAFDVNDEHATQSVCNEIKWILNRGGQAAKGKIPADIKKDLVQWVHSNSWRDSINDYTVEQLMAIPGIRPEGKTLLFRGLLMQKWQFSSRSRGTRRDALPIGYEVNSYSEPRCNGSNQLTNILMAFWV